MRRLSSDSVLLGLFAEGSPARTSVRQGGARVLAPKNPRPKLRACGTKCPGSCARCDPVGSSLRTYLRCELEALTPYSLTWKMRVTPAGRPWWVLGQSGLRTDGIAPGFSDSNEEWPTPSATPYGSSNNGVLRHGGVTPLGTESGRHPGTTLTDATVGARGNWPTPQAHDGTHGPSGAETRARGGREFCLPSVVGQQDPENSSTNGKSPGSSPEVRSLPRRLNSSWVAQLMGYPRTWLCWPSVELLVGLRLGRAVGSGRTRRKLRTGNDEND